VLWEFVRGTPILYLPSDHSGSNPGLLQLWSASHHSHTPALQRPPPVASQTPRCPDPTQPHYRNVVFSVFAPCVLCRLSSAALYIVRHPDCSSNPPAIPCCLGTINASKRACGALSPIVCQTAGHFQPLGAQDSTSSSLTLLRDPTMTTMPSTRKRTRAASHAGAFACVLL